MGIFVVFRLNIIMIKLFLLFIFLILSTHSYATDRCFKYERKVRIAAFKYFGLRYPYHYNLGQLYTESGCRTQVTAFDGGEGIAQFMPNTTKYIRKLMNRPDLNPYNIKHAIIMQTFFLYKLHKSNFAREKNLWLTFMFYNSGIGTVKKEAVKAGSVDYDSMKVVCKRRKIKFKWGILDLCKVGYEYPELIYKHGERFKKFNSSWKYW